MTIVPDGKLDKDVTTLPYHFPRMPLVKYCKLSAEYHYWKSVRLLEQAAAQSGKVLVPAECLHWRRKARLTDCQLNVYRRSFYQLTLDQLTDQERKKYLELAAEQAAAEETA